MISATQTALTALQAFGTKIQSTANNVANSNTEGYKSTRVLLEETPPQGVRAVVEKTTTPGSMVYEDTTDGLQLLELSNVEISKELPDMTMTSNLYKANLQTLKVADELTQSTLELKA